jgi:hypothetical protein
MSNITSRTPSFVFGYWRPWKENSNLFDSYLDYARDTSLAKYSADTVGKYINQASKEQVQAINQLGQAIGRGMNVLSNQMSDINETLVFLNRNMDVQIEQQKLTNLLLQNIAELLRVPDSEKERQHSIELGIKFFVNASKDADLYTDALEELIKAESMMKQDYFVLHRIGCIYLYAEKYINPEKALEYFLRAAKYASVESDNKAARLANVLTKNFNTVNSDLNNSEKQIGMLAADSYEKAAFSAYILGRLSDAVSYQSKALKFNEIPQNRFFLAKYQIRNGEITEGVKNLNQCIDDEPIFTVASFKEIDLINEPAVINLISNKNQEIDNEINKLLDKWKEVESTEAASFIKKLIELSQKSYEIKVSEFKSIEKKVHEINENVRIAETQIDAYISEMHTTSFCTIDAKGIQTIINELSKAKNLPFEKMIEAFDKIKKQVDADKLIIGAKYADGIVFYVDKEKNELLIIKDRPLKLRCKWGGCYNGDPYVKCNNSLDFGSGEINTKNIIENASSKIEAGFFSSKKTKQENAATICDDLGWFLPSFKELKMAFNNLHHTGVHVFKIKHFRNSYSKGGFEKYGGEIIGDFIWTSSDLNLGNNAFVFSFDSDFHDDRLYGAKYDRTRVKSEEHWVLPVKRIKINQ